MLGAMLGLCETYVGQFLGPFLRAKNSAIFSAKKLGLELPMLGLFWVMLRPWGHVGPENPAAGKPPVIKISVPSRAVPGPAILGLC